MATELHWAARIWPTIAHLSDYLKSTASSVPLRHSASIRHKLPSDLEIWRLSQDDGTYNQLWTTLRPLFKNEGFTLYDHSPWDHLNQSIKKFPMANNYSFFDNRPTYYEMGADSTVRFFPYSGLQHALRSDDNIDYVVRVMSMKGSDDTNLRVWRKLSSTYPDILLSNNHILPIVKEIFCEDIIFAVFPKVYGNLQFAMIPAATPPETSVEDVAHMILQALEAIVYIHEKNIAHRDLFLENFVVDWVPKSLRHPSCPQPRVYLIDFETAVDFPKDTVLSDRLSTELPIPDEDYKRARAPELFRNPLIYCPFRLDMWQFGSDLIERFTSTEFLEIDTLWPTLIVENPEERPTADEVLKTLRTFVNATPPRKLQIPFDYVPIPR